MNEFKDVKNILVLKLRHIGDVLLTVPAIRALKETFPRARVTALVNSGTEDMLTLNPLVDEVIKFDRSIKGLPLAGRIKGELGFLSGLRSRDFDLSIDLTGGDRPALLGFLSGARYRLGYDVRAGFKGKKYLYTHAAPEPPRHTHTVLKDLGLLRRFGIDTMDLSVDIFTSPEDDAFVNRLLGENGVAGHEPVAHVHPASRWFFKCWTNEGMARVMDGLAEKGFKVVVTSGADLREIKKSRAIMGMMRSSGVDLSGRLTLKQTASLSKRSAIFFGVDSAPMHMAAASGAKVVAVFGPSGAFHWGPWDNMAAARQPTPYPEESGVQTFGRNVVIQKAWECVPCGKDGCDGNKKSRCLDELEPAFVWKILEEVLAPEGRPQ